MPPSANRRRFGLARARRAIAPSLAAAVLSSIFWTAPARASLDEATRAYEAGRHAEALAEFQFLAKAGDATAQYRLARMYQLGEGAAADIKEALEWYRKSAAQNQAEALYALGLLYDQGYGVKQNSLEAFKWFKKAADRGDAQAQFTLGYMLQNGTGVKADGPEALRWYRRAAEQGHAIGLFAMGLCYRQCPGVMRDKVMIHMWMELAIPRMGEGTMRNAALTIRDKTAAGMTQRELAEARQLAADWLSKYSAGAE